MKKKLLALVLSAVFTTAFAETLIIHISPTGSSELTADGLTWENAVSLDRGRSLINFYNNQSPAVPTEVWAKSGTYTLTSDAFQMTIPMTIYGGFAGNETSRAQRNWKLNQTILHQSNSAKGVIFSNVEAEATLDGWILENGSKTSAGSCGNLYSGGTLRNCIIRNNKTTGAGVLMFTGVANSTKKMTIENCLIINNECGISPVVTQIAANSLVDIINTTIANNYCAASGAGVVVGINNATGVTLNLINSIVYGNQMGDQTIPTSVAATNAVKNLYNNAWDVQATNGTRANNIVLSSTPFNEATPYVGIANGTNKLFSAIDTSDFTLRTGSTCINAGNNSYMTATTDLAVNTRILNTTVDIGCYEASVSTAVNEVKVSGLKVSGSKIYLPENAIGKTVQLVNANGLEIKNFVAENRDFVVSGKGLFIVKINNEVYKVIL